MSVFSVLPTPFDARGDFDPDSLRRVIDLFLADGVTGFTELGVTSEVARLTDRERDVVLDTVLTHVCGRAPVVAGTTADGLRTCIEYSRRAKKAGAASLMISPPRMAKINSAMTGFALRRRGAITTPAVRPPGGTLDQPTMVALDRVMNWVSAS